MQASSERWRGRRVTKKKKRQVITLGGNWSASREESRGKQSILVTRDEESEEEEEENACKILPTSHSKKDTHMQKRDTERMERLLQPEKNTRNESCIDGCKTHLSVNCISGKAFPSVTALVSQKTKCRSRNRETEGERENKKKRYLVYTSEQLNVWLKISLLTVTTRGRVRDTQRTKGE